MYVFIEKYGKLSINYLHYPFILGPLRTENVNSDFYLFRTLFPYDRMDLTDELIQRAEIKRSLRSYQFSIEEIDRVCKVYQDICNRLPFIYDFDYRNPKSLRDYQSIKTAETELCVHLNAQNKESKEIDLMEKELRSAETVTG